MFRYLTVIVWISVIAGGMYWLQSYAATPSDVGSANDHWPGETGLPEPRFQPSLLMFVHPRCPCTRASLTELERLLPAHREQILLVATVPANVHDTEWTESFVKQWADEWTVDVFFDGDGRETRSFGATTSGFCLVHDETGTLLFRGGLTASRGHAGANRASDAVAELLKGRLSDVDRHSVFGCRLVGCP